MVLLPLSFMAVLIASYSGIFAINAYEGFKKLINDADSKAGLQKRAPMDRYNYLPEEYVGGATPFSSGRRQKSKKRASCFSVFDSSDDENEWDQSYEESPSQSTHEAPYGPGKDGRMTYERYNNYYAYNTLPDVEYFEYKRDAYRRKEKKARKAKDVKTQEEYQAKADALDNLLMVLQYPDPEAMKFYINAYNGKARWMERDNDMNVVVKGMRKRRKAQAWENAYQSKLSSA